MAQKVGKKTYPDKILRILDTRGLNVAFMEHAKREFSIENCMFLLDSNRGMETRELFDKYLATSAPMEVNVPGHMFGDARALAEAGDWDSPEWINLVAEVRSELANLLQSDTLSRFWGSEPFIAYHVKKGGKATDARQNVPDTAAEAQMGGSPLWNADLAKARLGFRNSGGLKKVMASYRKEGQSRATLAAAARTMSREEQTWSAEKLLQTLQTQGYVEDPPRYNALLACKRTRVRKARLMQSYLEAYQRNEGKTAILWRLTETFLHKAGAKGRDPASFVKELVDLDVVPKPGGAPGGASGTDGGTDDDTTAEAEAGGAPGDRLNNPELAAEGAGVRNVQALAQVMKLYDKGDAKVIGAAQLLMQREKIDGTPGSFLGGLVKAGYLKPKGTPADRPDATPAPGATEAAGARTVNLLGSNAAQKLENCGFGKPKDRILQQRVNELAVLLKARDKEGARDLYRQLQKREPKDSAARTKPLDDMKADLRRELKIRL